MISTSIVNTVLFYLIMRVSLSTHQHWSVYAISKNNWTKFSLKKKLTTSHYNCSRNRTENVTIRVLDFLYCLSIIFLINVKIWMREVSLILVFEQWNIGSIYWKYVDITKRLTKKLKTRNFVLSRIFFWVNVWYQYRESLSELFTTKT